MRNWRKGAGLLVFWGREKVQKLQKGAGLNPCGARNPCTKEAADTASSAAAPPAAASAATAFLARLAVFLESDFRDHHGIPVLLGALPSDAWETLFDSSVAISRTLFEWNSILF